MSKKTENRREGDITKGCPDIFDAKIEYGKSCGWNFLGKEAYVKNKLDNHTVRATVQTVSKHSDRPPVTSTHPYTIGAGDRVSLPCTRAGWINGSTFEYCVIGTEVL